jgi:hypothetical protein
MHTDRREFVGLMHRLFAAGDGQRSTLIAVFSWMDYFLQAYEGLDTIDFCY